MFLLFRKHIAEVLIDSAVLSKFTFNMSLYPEITSSESFMLCISRQDCNFQEHIRLRILCPNFNSTFQEVSFIKTIGGAGASPLQSLLIASGQKKEVLC